jgi:transposase InsO family protein
LNDPNPMSRRTTLFREVAGLVWHVGHGRYQLVVPPKPEYLRDRVLQECHDAPHAGHLGKHKTLARVQQRFWWSGMAADVAEYCRQCSRCQSTKISKQRQNVILHPPRIPVRRWQELSLDFVTGLAMTSRGFDAVLTITDRVSKMVHLIPLQFKGSSAERVARLFVDHVWRLHGMPLKIYSDRDVRFTSAFWNEIARLTGMMMGMTTAYHPQGNGQAENTNATMEQVLRAYVEPLGTDWDQHLSACEYAINDSVHRSTGLSPFMLMYGESPCTQLDYFIEATTPTASNNPQASMFVDRWKRNLRRARTAMNAAQVTQKA